MERYERYKPTGISWMREIPEHWEIKKLKHLLSFSTGGTPSTHIHGYYDGEEPWVTISDMDGKFISGFHCISLKGVKSARIPLTPSGSLLYSFKLSVGQVAFANFDLYTNEAIASFAPQTGVNLGYWYYALPDFVIKNANTNIYGAFLLNQELMKNAVLIAPPLDEQERIAAFLDQKTTEINLAIAKKEQLIELLLEQRNIRVHQAVLRGLNPDVPLRESGISWIGAIPKHWKVIPNRYIFREQNTRSRRGEETHLSMSQRFGLLPAKELDVQTLQSESYDGAKLCQKGDLVQNRLKAHLAVFAVAPCDGLVSPDYSVFRLQRTENQAVYFERLFKTPNYLGELNRRVRGIVVGFLRLYSDDFNAIPALVPPVDEQREIVRYIEDTNDAFAIVQAKIDAEISKLQEFKAILVASAVTGKIKV